MSITNPEFQSHRLNTEGIKKVEEVKRLFDGLLNTLTCHRTYVPLSISPFIPAPLPDESSLIPQGRHLSIVKTKLEEACMFAVKAVSFDPANQEGASVIKAAEGWLKTPFEVGQRCKGVGVDCANFIAAVYEEAGASDPKIQETK